jgi:acetate kinase
VYGGRQYKEPQLVTPELVVALKESVPLAPEHLPRELKAIEAVGRAFPGLPQVACFDTAFHCHMPEIATLYPLPRHFRNDGLMRYGFHGLSYAYILEKLGQEAAGGRLIIAHLGNGASMAALKDGKPLDTTMGLTPAGGLMMGTRSGDLDPGVILYLIEEKGLPASRARDVVNRQAGLLGVSGVSSDMQDLLRKEAHDPRAAEAIALFCYQAKKFLGALAAVLGGVDTLVFTAGIGEHAPSIRQRICEGMEFLGIRLDPERNRANASRISSRESAATVRVIKTDEEIMIARQTRGTIWDKSHKSA